MGAIYMHPTNKQWVIKYVNDVTKTRHEIEMHRKMAELGIAPLIHNTDHQAIVMDRVTPLPPSGKLSLSQEKQLVAIIAKSVAAGLLHNDLHQANIGWKYNDPDTMVMFDFGYTVQINPIVDDMVYLQVVMAQLYALIDPCSSANTTWCYAGQNKYAADVIYGIRQNDITFTGPLLTIKRDAEKK